MKWLTNPLVSLLLNLAMLTVAIIALIVARQTLTESNRQFIENSIAADSLFKLQLKYSKDLNDSIVSQIKMLQSISSKQMEIIDQQLGVAVQTYHTQLYSGRPVIALGESKIASTEVISSDSISPQILTLYSNVGKRQADNLVLRAFFVTPDFSGLRSSAAFPLQSEHLEPGITMELEFKPRILAIHKKEFYYCIDCRYTDDILKQNFYFVHYYNYHESRGLFYFNNCIDAVKPHIKETINRSMSLERLPLFDN
ncbi:MAG TPA: hypothetical protein VLX68_02690 [Chitinivibrionales bacterium]|nr:hypothetical protein [Chitinivibrionales bacterium]